MRKLIVAGLSALARVLGGLAAGGGMEPRTLAATDAVPTLVAMTTIAASWLRL